MHGLRAQVLRDILEYRMKDFTPAQKDQWRAMKTFHDMYKTSDSVPNLPISLRASKESIHPVRAAHTHVHFIPAVTRRTLTRRDYR